MLAAAAGCSDEHIARELALSVHTVRKWRGVFPDGSLPGNIRGGSLGDVGQVRGDAGVGRHVPALAAHGLPAA